MTTDEARRLFRTAIDEGGQIEVHPESHDLGRGPEAWCCIHVGGTKLVSLPRREVLTALYAVTCDEIERTEPVH